MPSAWQGHEQISTKILGHAEGGHVATRGDGMRVTLDMRAGRTLWPCLLALGAIALLAGGAAYAQNLDQGKSAQKLFADSCATCHHSPRGLTKDRFRLTLYLFLQKHYSSGSETAWALTSYLESVDAPQRGRSKGAAKSSAAHSAQSSSRPPAPVPQR
jgi:hypothetical protein